MSVWLHLKEIRTKMKPWKFKENWERGGFVLWLIAKSLVEFGSFFSAVADVIGHNVKQMGFKIQDYRMGRIERMGK